MYRDELEAARARADALERECKDHEATIVALKKIIGEQIGIIRALKNRPKSAQVTISPHGAISGRTTDAHRYGSAHSNTWAFNGNASNTSNRGGW
jgi:hypothetical protein